MAALTRHGTRVDEVDLQIPVTLTAEILDELTQPRAYIVAGDVKSVVDPSPVVARNHGIPLGITQHPLRPLSCQPGIGAGDERRQPDTWREARFADDRTHRLKASRETLVGFPIANALLPSVVDPYHVER